MVAQSYLRLTGVACLLGILLADKSAGWTAQSRLSHRTEAVVQGVTKGPFPQVVLTLSLSQPAPGAETDVIRARPQYAKTRAGDVDYRSPTNVKLLGAYYLLPGDTVRVTVTLVRTPSGPQWYIQSLERVTAPPKARPAVLRVDLTTDKSAYSLGEPVMVTLTISNLGGTPAELTFPTGQKYEFTASRAGREVWRWSAGRVFTQAVQRMSVRPGEEISFRERWNQTDSDGDRVPPGRYRISGWLTAEGREEMTRSSAEIEIAAPKVSSARTIPVYDVVSAGRAMLNKEVALEGHYRGERVLGRGALRRFWVLEDDSGSILVSGTGRANLQPGRDMDVRVRVEGLVKQTAEGLTYIHAWSVSRLED
ncbi:MAG: BsuPI-related putative proteinase inhibitor [Armatimonadota bacterium]